LKEMTLLVMNKVPEKAMILAAGFGKRLQPLTETMPKPLMPLWNKPLLDHIIELLKSWGVKEIVINTHWLPEQIASHVAAGNYGVEIRISQEDDIRGTGGALESWRDYFADDPFWVINGDIAADLDCQPLIDAYYSQPHLMGACWVTDRKGPRSVEVDRLGRITCYRSPEPGIDGTYTFCGLQLLSPRIFDFIPHQNFSTIVDAYESAMYKNLFVKAVNLDESYWNDAGTLERYREIHMETKRLARVNKAGGRLYDATADLMSESKSGFMCVGKNTKIGSGFKGNGSIIFDGVVIDKNSSARDSIIQGGHLAGKLDDLCCISGANLSESAVIKAAEAMNWEKSLSAFAFLGRRGSDRSFWRGLYRDKRAVFIQDGGERFENQRYAGHAVLLQRADIPTPEVLYCSSDKKTLVLEDLGNDSLQSRMKAVPDNADKYYRAVIEKIASFHVNVTRLVAEENVELEPSFDKALYEWEHALFEKHILMERYGFDALPEDVHQELIRVAAALESGSQTVIHRDLQSSNILFKGRRFAFIDFQGMRFGSPAYDIASLLYDPYVKIDPKLRCTLAAVYCKSVPDIPDVLPLFFKGAVQRLIQSLGAFGRLSGLGHKSFEINIISGLENLLEAADASNMDALGGLVEELIAREQIRRG